MDKLRESIRRIITEEETSGLFVPFARVLLRVLSFFYQGGAAAKAWAYRAGFLKAVALPRPVVSVGNITWGGAGKTPLVQFLVTEILAKGKKPAILTRGYMPRFTNAAGSDEAELFRQAFSGVPVLQGQDRYRQGRDFLKKHPADIFLMDDGFQHRRLKRDLDVVAVDALNPFGNRWLIPAGILREPMSALRRADIVVLTRVDLVDAAVLSDLRRQVSAINPEALLIESQHVPDGIENMRSGERRDLDALSGQPVLAFSAIGMPKGFSLLLERYGVPVAERMSFPDHHQYTANDIACAADRCRSRGIRTIITTEKDAVKLRAFSASFPTDIGIEVLRIKIKIVKGKNEFLSRIFSLLDH